MESAVLTREVLAPAPLMPIAAQDLRQLIPVLQAVASSVAQQWTAISALVVSTVIISASTALQGEAKKKFLLVKRGKLRSG